jgi:aryl-phospho-beta-D-glucosidase BglC (GH1 family)
MGRRLLAFLFAAVLIGQLPTSTAWEGPAAKAAGPVPAGLHDSASASDPLYGRMRADLHAFTSWLDRGGKRGQGLIGEVGWPGNPKAAGDARWNLLARDWYRQAEAAGLWVSGWATGEFWASSYKLLTYAPEGRGVNAQALVIEGQPASRLRGLNVAGAEFATPVDEPTSTFSNKASGEHGRDYVYPSPATLAYLAERGVTFVRLPVRWERLQPRLGGPLASVERQRLLAAVAAARAADLEVVLDVHNYGAYYLFSPAAQAGVRRPIGSPEVTTAHFADLWSRLAALFAHDRTILGYGLMNEPVGMRSARTWEAASRAAVRAIRRAGSSQRIFVQSYFWGGVRQFALYHPNGPWINDARTWYEAHQYFDHDRSARYEASYDKEVARAAEEGYGKGSKPGGTS